MTGRGEELVQVAGGVREGAGFHAEALHEGDVEVAEQRGVGGVAVDGKMAPVGEAAAGDEGGQVLVAVAAGVAHAGADEDDGGIEQGAILSVFFGAELLEEAREAGHVGAFELDEVAHHAGVVAVVREGVVAGREGLAVDGEDLAEAIETEGDNAGGFGFDGESHEVVEDLFGLHHEIGGDGVGFGELVVGLGDGFVDGLDLAGHAAFDGADGVEVFAEFGLVGGGEGGVEAFGVGEDFVEGAAAARRGGRRRGRGRPGT
jgi:hypothetical protein